MRLVFHHAHIETAAVLCVGMLACIESTEGKVYLPISKIVIFYAFVINMWHPAFRVFNSNQARLLRNLVSNAVFY